MTHAAGGTPTAPKLYGADPAGAATQCGARPKSIRSPSSSGSVFEQA